MAAAAGQIGPLKTAFNTSTKLKSNVLFLTTSRKFATLTVNNIHSNPQLMNLINNLWNDGVGRIVTSVLESPIEWRFIGIVGGISQNVNNRIDSYLSREEFYRDGDEVDGPVPSLSA